MKNIALFLVFLFMSFCSGYAQRADQDIERMMTRRVLSRADVSYNIASMVPRLYREDKTDTVRQLLNYYSRNYGISPAMTSLGILLDIRDREFREKLMGQTLDGDAAEAYYRQEILGLLSGFNELCTAVANDRYTEDINSVYGSYLGFVGTLAAELKGVADLSPVERFLVTFYAHPSDTLFKQLEATQYDGTSIKAAWLAQKRQQEKLAGFTIGFNTGVWVPTGALSLVGAHPYFGMFFGGRGTKFAIEGSFNFRFLRSPNSYVVIADGNPYTTNYFFGGYLGLDGMYVLRTRNRRSWEVLGGAGYEGFDALNSDSNDPDAVAKSIGSLNLNAGIGYRFMSVQRTRMSTTWGQMRPTRGFGFLAIQAKYNYTRYDNAGGTYLNGNSFTIGVVAGGCSRAVKKM